MKQADTTYRHILGKNKFLSYKEYMMKEQYLIWLVIARHAECNKNVRDEHGGHGDDLTVEGLRQVSSLVRKLRKINTKQSISFDSVYYPDVIQVKQTALFLSKALGIPAKLDDRIAPLSLGKLSGLSRDEASNRFPVEAERLERWREGKLEILDLNLSGSESFDSFWERGKLFLNEMMKDNISPIVISSRSTLILLMNMLLGKNPRVEGEYKPWNFSYASYAYFRHNGDWSYQISNGIKQVV